MLIYDVPFRLRKLGALPSALNMPRSGDDAIMLEPAMLSLARMDLRNRILLLLVLLVLVAFCISPNDDAGRDGLGELKDIVDYLSVTNISILTK